MTTTVSTVLTAVPSEIDRLQDEVSGLWAAEPGVPPGLAQRFETALVEIFGNVVQHGQEPGAPATSVEVVLEITEDRVTAALADQGRPVAIDLAAVSMPDVDAEGGRGLALAVSCADVLAYERDGDVNRWRVTCRRPDRDVARVTA